MRHSDEDRLGAQGYAPMLREEHSGMGLSEWTTTEHRESAEAQPYVGKRRFSLLRILPREACSDNEDH